MKKLLLYLTFSGLLFAFNQAHAQDAITNMTAPSTVTQGEKITVTIDYVADTNPKDLNVQIKGISDGQSYGFTKVTVNAGTGSKDVSFNVSMDIPVADNAYKIICYMTTVGGGFDPTMPQIELSNISAIAALFYDIPVNNGDIENTTPIFQDANNENKWSIEGMWFNENAVNVFDAANSGLAPGEGMNGSQALKSVIHNTTGASAAVTLSIGDVDISSNGPGTYMFTFYSKTLNAPTSRPFWIVCNTFDKNGVNVTGTTLTAIDNGGTVNFSGMQNSYLKQTVSVEISGNTAKYLRLQVQHGKENNTYWFDDISLVGPEGSPTAITRKPAATSLNVSPNPASTQSVIKSQTPISKISLYSLSGKLIMSQQVDSNEYTLDVSSFTKGLYILKVTNKTGTSTTKFVIN